MADQDARLATRADARDVARLLHARSREAGMHAPRAEVLAERVVVLLERDDAFVVVAGAPPNAVGVVTLRPNVWSGAVTRVDELYVEPAERGDGIGTRVLVAILAEATARGAGELEVEVDEPDVDAHRFFERHGLPLADADSGERACVLRRALG